MFSKFSYSKKKETHTANSLAPHSYNHHHNDSKTHYHRHNKTTASTTKTTNTTQYYYRISHFSVLAGKYSPILGFGNQQD
jgi:hypothetical protein